MRRHLSENQLIQSQIMTGKFLETSPVKSLQFLGRRAEDSDKIVGIDYLLLDGSLAYLVNVIDSISYFGETTQLNRSQVYYETLCKNRYLRVVLQNGNTYLLRAVSAYKRLTNVVDMLSVSPDVQVIHYNDMGKHVPSYDGKCHNILILRQLEVASLSDLLLQSRYHQRKQISKK